MVVLIVLGVIAAIAVMWFVGSYNGLVRLRNMAEEGWSGIDVQLKRRYDLIPNIIETVKGYATHEQETFEKVTEMRSKAINAGSVKEQAEAENMLSGALKSIFALSENYPDLKANENFKQLQETLAEVEDKIQMSRRYYNGTVRDLNIKCETFPSVIVANMFGFRKRDYFEIEESERENVKVSFS